MAEVRLARSLPPRQPQDGEGDELGFIFDDVTRRLLGLYGDNQGPDILRFEVEIGGDLFGFVLSPGQSRQIRLPTRARLLEEVRPPVLDNGRMRPERRWIPYTRLISERVYGNPRGNSPTVLSVTSTQFGSASTTHNHSLPSTINAGDGILPIFAGENSDFATYNLIEPSGFTEKADYGWDLSGVRHRLGVYIKVAAGTEGGGTANVGSQDAVAGAGQVYRIQEGTWGESVDAVEVSAKAQADDGANANPPNHTPSAGGTLDRLWIPVASIQDVVASAAPTNYTNLTTNSGGDVGLSTARRGLSASSEDAGPFTSATEHWLAAMISVEPAAAGGEEYIETNRLVSIVSDVGLVDSLATSEVLEIDITSVFASIDAKSMSEAMLVSIISAVEMTDDLSYADILSLAITSSVTPSDSLVAIDSVEITIAATVSAEDVAAYQNALSVAISSLVEVIDDFGVTEQLTINITSEITITDQRSMVEALATLISSSVAIEESAALADELGISIVTTLSVTDVITSGFDETGLSILVSSTITLEDQAALAEQLSETVLATVTLADLASLSDGLSVTIVSTVVGTDAFGVIDETGRQVLITSSVTGIDQASLSDDLLVDVASTFGSDDALSTLEELAVDISSSIVLTDQLSLTEVLAIVLASDFSIEDQQLMAEFLEVDLVATLSLDDLMAALENVQISIEGEITVDDQYRPILGATRLSFRAKTLSNRQVKSKIGFKFKGKTP